MIVPAVIHSWRHRQDDAGIAKLDRVNDRRARGCHALRLLGDDRDLVADLERRGLVVEHHEPRSGQGAHLGSGLELGLKRYRRLIVGRRLAEADSELRMIPREARADE